jgi:hypothetical protein
VVHHLRHVLLELAHEGVFVKVFIGGG